MTAPFHFYTRLHLVKLLGLRARNPVELFEGIKKVPASSIYYHTHRFLQQHHYLSPEPPNDFAYWLSLLNLRELSEAFASVDTVSFRSIEELRDEFIRILTEYIPAEFLADADSGSEAEQPAPVDNIVKALAGFSQKPRAGSRRTTNGNHIPDCAEGQEFHFMSCITAVLPTPYIARDLKEFIEVLGKVSISSLYFHTFEACLRLERDENDFASWFREMGKTELADQLSNLDPYTITLEGLRQKIIGVVTRYA